MPAPVHRKSSGVAKTVCIACSGTGISSKKGRCFPCGGKGHIQELKVWKCPECGSVHRGFTKNICYNLECPSKQHAKAELSEISTPTKKPFTKKKATKKKAAENRGRTSRPLSIGKEMDLD